MQKDWGNINALKVTKEVEDWNPTTLLVVVTQIYTVSRLHSVRN
jgi:hypothetical protein